MKLLLGIPSAGAPADPFVASLAALHLPPEIAFERTVVTGNYIPAQRDLIVERALELGADVLVMCDDDMVLPPDALIRLSDALAADESAGLAGALYYSRDGLRPMVVDDWNPQDTRTAVVPAFDRTPVEVGGVGFGCVAIRVRALQGLMPPYFAAHVFVERGAGRVRLCDEDYLFCARLRSAGWRVLLHPGVRCGHYDRGRKRIEPQVWESAEETARRRIAVFENGRYRMVPERDVASSVPEAHLAADLDYVIVP